MTLNTIEGEMKFFGSVVTVSADNLGSHAIGGFKEGFRALRPCRQCLTVYYTKLSASMCMYRTRMHACIEHVYKENRRTN